MTKEATPIILPSNPADRKAIMDAMQEISNSYTRAESEKTFVKEAIAALNEKFYLPKRKLAQLSKVLHKGNFNEVSGEFENLRDLYETLVAPTTVAEQQQRDNQ